MYSKMILLALAMTLTYVCAADQPAQPRARFLAATSTQTKLTFSTVTASSTVARTCAVLVNVTGACRRRRGMEFEKPIILSFDESVDAEKLFPTKPLEVVPTAAPIVERGAPAASPALESSSEQLADIEIIGLDADCRRGRIGLGLTVLFTTVQTAIFTTYSYITEGSVPFFIGGCTPSPLVYSTC